MTLDEKLSVFRTMALETEEEERKSILHQYEEELAQEIEAHRKEKEQQAEADAKQAVQAAGREQNAAFSEKNAELRQELAQKEDALIELLFSRALERLTALKESDEYPALLEKKILEGKKLADGQELTVYLDSSDAALSDVLEKRTGVRPVITRPGEEFLGGLRIVIPGRHLLIDNSFKNRLEELRENFSID